MLDAAALEEQFWAKADRTGGPDACWVWNGWRERHGYGLVGRSGRRIRAHRMAYELAIGPVPAGLVLDHLCRNTSCVNPAHLEPVTDRENILRGDAPPARNARRTTCIRGHLFSGDNLHVEPNGSRHCVTCRRLLGNRRYAARKAQSLSEPPQEPERPAP